MQAFIDRQFAFDTYLPGTPHEVGDISDMFPYHIWGRGNIPKTSANAKKDFVDGRRRETARRRRYPSCVEEASAYGNLQYLILLYAQGKLEVLRRKAIYEGSDASALMWAAFKGHLPIVKFLVAVALKECQQQPSPPGAASAGGQNVPYASHEQQQEAFHRFINYESALGHTALQWAIIGGRPDIVRFLLDHNADPFHRDRQGFDAAFVAVQNDHLAILLMLLEDSVAERGITLVGKSGKGKANSGGGGGGGGGNTSAENELAIGIGSGNTGEEGESDGDDNDAVYVVDLERITKVLNDARKPPQQQQQQQQQQQRYGAYFGVTTNNDSAGNAKEPPPAFALRKTNYYYLDPSMRDVEGHNLLHWAAYRNSPAACQYLVQRWRYDVNVQDTHGRTPVMWAAREGFSEVIEFLCLHGANRSLTDKEGYTAAQYAVVRNHPEAVYVLKSVPEVDFTRIEENGLLQDAKKLQQVRAYVPIRVRRGYGTVKMILTHSLFALQCLCGALYMALSYTFLSLVPSVLSYFPFGVYFFKNMLWTAFVGHPEQSSKSVKRNVGKEAGLPSTLAEAVRGTWFFRLREPANLACVTLMMCLQMFCWTQLGLTPFIHSIFSFNFLFRPFRMLATSAVSLRESALSPSAVATTSAGGGGGGGAAAAGENCAALVANAKEHAECLSRRLVAFVAQHNEQYRDSFGKHISDAERAATSIVGSGVNLMSEVGDARSLLAYTSPALGAGAGTGEGGEGFLTPEQLFSSRHYVGGSGPLHWLFGGDAITMVAVVLPLLFSLTLLFFLLTKVTARASAMRFRAINERFQATKRGSRKGEGPYDREGTLATSPVWRILRSRQYAWLHPRALLLERHTQIPCRAFYCPEQDVIVHRYDGYSILLDCPIGASNHVYFVLGLTCFVLFQFFLLFWGIHQVNFFLGLHSGVACRYESWTSGFLEGFSSAENVRATLGLANATAALSAPEQLMKCMPHGGHQSVVNWAWLNNFLALALHGLSRKQSFYIDATLLPSYVAYPDSLLRRLWFVFAYYWWPTRANLFGAFLLHFAFYSVLLGAAIALRQWSGVWRGATRMELANPVTPCTNFAGRLIATFPLSCIFAPSSATGGAAQAKGGGSGECSFEVKDYDKLLTQRGETDRTGDGTAAQLCNVDLEEESYYQLHEPAKARSLRAEGVPLFTKSVYAESSWAVGNVLWFLLGRAGRRWDRAMAVSDSLKPVKAPMLAEFS